MFFIRGFKILCSKSQGKQLTHKPSSNVKINNFNPRRFCGGSTKGGDGGSLMMLGSKTFCLSQCATAAVLQLSPLPKTAAFTACFKFFPHTLSHSLVLS